MRLYNNANDSYYWYIDSAGTVLNSYNTTGTIPPTYIMQQDGYSVTIYLITNNNDSCTSDTTSVIFTTVLDPVALLDTNPRGGCHPFQPNIQSLSTPGTSHSWFVNGNPIQTPTPQTTLDYVFTNLSYTDSITYEVKLVIQAGGSGGLPCTDTIIDTVTVYPKPNAVFSSVIGNQCVPSCDDLIDASVYNNTSSIVWNWTITEDNSLYPSNPTTSNVQNPNICFPDNQSGTDVEYTVELIIEDTYGCKDTTTENIIIYTRPVANFSIVDTGCGEVTYTPTNNSQNVLLGQWTVTPNTNVSIINPNDQQPNITFPENTSQGDSIVYTVELIVTSADSCTDTITEIVTIYPTPEVIFSVSDSVGCDSLEVIFTNNSDPFNGEDTTFYDL